MSDTVLIIDDEPDLISVLDYNLTKLGFLVLPASNGEEGLSLATEHLPDIILLDLMMPGLDGWEVCKRLRKESKTARIPILMLTARGDESDRIVGLELGADDYVSKPFNVGEVIARIKAILRRSRMSEQPQDLIKAGELLIDSGKHTATLSGKRLTLTATEFEILRILASKPGHVFTRETLINKALGENVAVMDRTIDVHVASVRRKLGQEGPYIETVRGAGYRWKE